MTLAPCRRCGDEAAPFSMECERCSPLPTAGPPGSAGIHRGGLVLAVVLFVVALVLARAACGGGA